MDARTIEIVAVAAVLAAASIPALARVPALKRAPSSIALLSASILLAGVVGLSVAASFREPVVPEIEILDRPVRDPVDGYVTSKTCRACHPGQYASWHASYHRTMTQVATSDAVVGDFDDVSLRFLGRQYHLERRGDEFWVTMDDPDWTGSGQPPTIERRIVMTTGSHHDQLYWYATPGSGRDLHVLPLDFRIEEQRWIPFVASFLLPPQSRFVHGQTNWTSTCIKCHTTYGRMRVEPTTQQIDSRVAEFGIACEACHGPAGPHVAENRDPTRRYRLHLGEDPDDTIVNPSDLDAARASEVCGQCHGLWVERRTGTDLSDSPARFVPGEEIESDRIYLQDSFEDPRFAAVDPMKHQTMLHVAANMPEYRRGKFWSDGMVRISGREYSGLIESPCYRGGDFSCLSCHEMHPDEGDERPLETWRNDQLAPDMEGNHACVACHPALAGAEALTAHTRHAPGSSGSTCYNCHMPHTGYGILKAHRSHEVDSPSVAASVETGRPNACNACHLDQTLAWAAEALSSGWGVPPPDLDEDERTIAASILWTLRGDAGQRILMAWHMGWAPALEASGSGWSIPFLATLLNDPYDAVRFVAGRSLAQRPDYADLPYDFLADPRHRAQVRADVLERWRRTARPARRASLLQDPEGALQLARLRRLLDERDTTPLSLHE